MKKIAIVGGTGYTGVELLRLLARHKGIEVCAVTSRAEAGKSIADVYPSLRNAYSMRFSMPDIDLLQQADLVFFATPNGIAMQHTEALLTAGTKVIDLAADFRFKDVKVWNQWYAMQHACPQVLVEAVYGLPEANKQAIQGARVVANPGCYPTAVQLGLLPLLKHNLVGTQGLIADCKSGVSGAGRTLALGNLLCEAGDNFKAYGVAGHRHLPEIQEQLTLAANQEISLTFVPHLTPMIRGIHATLYTQLKDNTPLEIVNDLFIQHYKACPFVDVMPLASHPETRSVRGSNICRLALHKPQSGNTLVVLSVIDNLVKGAAGQAVHNMNLMLGLPETMGLELMPLSP